MKSKKSFASISFLFVLFSCGRSVIQSSESITNHNLTLENTDEFKEAKSLSALGTQKLLVVPVQFQGEREFSQEDLTRIQKAFFQKDLSTSEGKNYYSVSEFYSQSSLGQLSFNGEVTDVLKVPFTVEEMTSDGNYFPGVPAQYMMDSSSYPSSYFQDYDTDKDGYVDAVVFVYSSPT